MEPIVGSSTLYVSFAFLNVYKFSPGEVGLALLGIVIGIFLAVATFVVVHKTLYAKAKERAPEGTGGQNASSRRTVIHLLVRFFGYPNFPILVSLPIPLSSNRQHSHHF